MPLDNKNIGIKYEKIKILDKILPNITSANKIKIYDTITLNNCILFNYFD